MENTKIIYVVIVIRVVHQILTLLLLTDPPGLPGGPVVRAFTFQCWGASWTPSWGAEVPQY